ncbi:MAG: biopolymer transporter ExbD [Candidatus Synoicihabitans palmerolidicus]|nr:biopolymer transporter ExbD [Candidatus Synoicihabitans palmerolidicus]
MGPTEGRKGAVMKANREMFAEEDGFSLDSMLDIVFLLLIYFMVTAAFVKEAADISMSLPSRMEQEEPLAHFLQAESLGAELDAVAVVGFGLTAFVFDGEDGAVAVKLHDIGDAA